MKFTKDEVWTFKMTSGEEIIAKVLGDVDQYGMILVEEPFSIAPSQQGMGLIPAMFTAEMTGEKRLNTKAIALYAPTESGVKMRYLEATTGLKIPDKKLILG